MAKNLLQHGQDISKALEAAREAGRVEPVNPEDDAVSLAPLLGHWAACDAETRGIVQVVIGDGGAQPTVNVFGACHPSPCDWGVVEGIAYADSIVANDAIAFTAMYDHGFSETMVTGKLDYGTLIVDSFTLFKDGSGRSAYYARAYLCKQG